MSARGWLVNMMKTPPAIHIMMSLLHELICAGYLADLRDAVAAVKGGAGDLLGRGWNAAAHFPPLTDSTCPVIQPA
jgi:hypothetical protein